MLTPEKIAAFNKITGVNAPLTGEPVASSRGDKIRQIAQKATITQPVETKPSITGTLLKPTVEGVKGLGELYGGGENGIANKLKNDVTSGAKDMQSGFQNFNKLKGAGQVIKGTVKAGLRTAGDVAGAIYAPVGAVVGATGIGSAISGVQKNVEEGKGLVGNAVDKFTDIPAVQEFATKHPNAGEDFNRVLNLLFSKGEKGTIEPSTVIDRTKTQISGVPDKVKSTLTSAKESVFPKPTEVNEKSVIDKYNRAIKPTVAGKSTAGQVADSNSRVVSGVKSIAENKSNLSFTDADGNIISGETPKTVDQMSQAISQTKKSIYDQYDSLAKQAGEKGIVVEAPKVAQELQPVIDSKALNIANPKAVEYAKSLQERLNREGSIDAKTAQEVIEHYNASLKAFYRNPNYDTASQAGIDSMIANKFRQELDNGITGATGEQYQALKNKYGALASMEKDVTRRNIVWGRQNNMGMSSGLANIASGAELVRGLVTMNPADLAISGTIKGISAYNKYINNPDVNIQKMFGEVNRVGNNQSSASQQSGTTQVFQTKSLAKPEEIIETLPDTTSPKVESKGGVGTSPKKGFIDSIKDIPNKEGGFVKNPLAGETKPNLKSNESLSSSNSTTRFTPETKENIIRIIDDHRLKGGKDLELQYDAARIAEDHNIKLPKKYSDLVKILEKELEKQD